MDLYERADDRGARLRAGLADALNDAIRSRDTVAVSALRTTRAETAEREHAAADCTASGLSALAERLHAEATVLTSVIAALDLGR